MAREAPGTTASSCLSGNRPQHPPGWRMFLARAALKLCPWLVLSLSRRPRHSTWRCRRPRRPRSRGRHPSHSTTPAGPRCWVLPARPPARAPRWTRLDRWWCSTPTKWEQASDQADRTGAQATPRCTPADTVRAWDFRPYRTTGRHRTYGVHARPLTRHMPTIRRAGHDPFRTASLAACKCVTDQDRFAESLGRSRSRTELSRSLRLPGPTFAR